MNKDLRKIVRALEAQGYEVVFTSEGHACVFQDGEYVATFAGTPSDHLGYRNSLSKAKRKGFRWPPRR